MNQLPTSEILFPAQHCDLPLPVLNGLTMQIWMLIIVSASMISLLICLILSLVIPFVVLPVLGLILVALIVKKMIRKCSLWHSDKPLGSFTWHLAYWFASNVSAHLFLTDRNTCLILERNDPCIAFLQVGRSQE